MTSGSYSMNASQACIFNKSVYLSQPNMQMQVHRVQIMTTRLYGVTGSTQEADDPLIRATNVLKTKIECMYSTKHEKEKELPPKNHN